MDEPRLDLEPQILGLVACPRSGSTLLMRIFAESLLCSVTSEPILMSKTSERDVSGPDYSILENPCHHNVLINAIKSGQRFLTSKAEDGNSSHEDECRYDVCPSPSTYAMARPVFLVRDPIRVFDSWNNVGWTEERRLTNCYTNLFRMLHQAPLHAVYCLLYEHLIQDP